MGAHDMDFRNDDVYVRFSKKGDKFVPFGETDVELMEEGELIYSVGDMVKTRRWIWRQGEEGKITNSSKKYIFSYRWFY